MHFDWSEGAVSSVPGDIVAGPAAALTAVALVVGRRARASGWGARAAVALAERWAGPRRPVLVDFDLEKPALHEAAGVANDEGVADVAQYGLSLEVVRQVQPAYDLVTAGLYAPDPGAALRAPVWDAALQDAARRWETVLAWVPADMDGAAAMVARCGAVIVLAEPEEAAAVVESLPSRYAVLAVLTPREQAEAEASTGATAATAATEVTDATDATDASEATEASGRASETEAERLVIAAAADLVISGTEEDAGRERRNLALRLSDAEFEKIRLPKDRAAREALIGDLRERQRAARFADAPAGPAAGGAAGAATAGGAGPSPVLLPAGGSEHEREMRLEASADDVTLDSMDPGDPAPVRQRRFRRPLLWTLSVVLFVSLLAGAWRFLAGRLGFGPVPAPPAATAAPADTAEPAGPVFTSSDAALPYSVAVEAHTDLATAFNRITALGGEEGLSFFIAPLEREGTLYYHVMAGPAGDSAAAVALRDTLLARRIKTAATPTDVRHTPLTFLVGDYGTVDVAEQTMSELQRLDVPSYMIHADAADGYPLYRVLVGAFTSPAEADVMRQLLQAAGVQDSLVTRMGSISP